MIGFVIVSHSARIAEGVCELAGQAAHGRVLLAPAGGTGDRANPIGTDAFRVLQAIESVYSEDGVVVLMDLGSALLSAETALELLAEQHRCHVHLCPAPLVEGAVAAVSLAAAGAGIAEILREARHALAGKLVPAQPPTGPIELGEELSVTLPNRLGLHARPAAGLVRRARGYAAHVTLENLTRPAGPADAASISAILGLGARQGHRLRLRARGAGARDALVALSDFLASGCGERDQAEEPAPAQSGAAIVAGELTGIPASSGFATGPLFHFRPAPVAVCPRIVADAEAERSRLLAAIAEAAEELRSLEAWSRSRASLDLHARN